MCMWCNSNNWVMFSVATSPRQHHFYGFLVARCCFTKLNSSLRCHVSWTLAAALGSAAARCGVGQRWDASWGWIYRNLGKDWEGRRWGKSHENPMNMNGSLRTSGCLSCFAWWFSKFGEYDTDDAHWSIKQNLRFVYIYIYTIIYIYIVDYIYIHNIHI